ncbi:hypothetical protein ACH5RR_017634 [Cinchona calisaya]|uniref:Uncharacterized protein n=1 Tax=Cinchona calisaya TaxID=153742 RepID=A0ABD2ZJ43_9GENT
MTLIFCKAKAEEASKIKAILGKYEKASGQLINLQKSARFLSKNTPEDMIEVIRGVLKIIQVVSQEKYIGLPMVIEKSKNQIFGYIRERVEVKLHNWKRGLLSQAGKETLLKYVVLAMPAHLCHVSGCQRRSARN